MTLVSLRAINGDAVTDVTSGAEESIMYVMAC